MFKIDFSYRHFYPNVFYVVELKESELVGKTHASYFTMDLLDLGACWSEMGGVIKFSLLFEVLKESSTGKCLHASHER